MRFFFLTAVVVTLALASQSQAGLFPGLLGQGSSNNGKGLARGRSKNSLAADLFGLATNPMSMFNGLTGGITLGGTNELGSGNIGGLLSLGGSGSNSVSWQSNGNRPSETLVTTITTTIRSWPVGVVPGIEKIIKSDGSVVWMITTISSQGVPGARLVRKPDGSFWYLLTVTSTQKPQLNLPVLLTLREIIRPNGQIQYIPYSEPKVMGTMIGYHKIIRLDGSVVYYITRRANPGQPGARKVRQPNGSIWWLITIITSEKPNDLPEGEPMLEIPGPNGKTQYVPYGPIQSGPNPNEQQPRPIGTRPEVQPVIKPDGSIMYFMTNIAQPGQPGAKQVRKPDGTYWWLITVSSPYKPTGNLPVADPVKEVEGPNGQPLYIPIGPNPSGQNPNGQNPNDQSPVPIGTKPEVQPVIKPDGTIMYFMTNIAQPGQPGAKQVRKPDGTYWWLITVSSPYKPTGNLPVADPVKEVEGPNGQPLYIPIGPNPSGQNPNDQSPVPIGTKPEVQPVIKPDGTIMYFMTNIAQPGQPGAEQVRKPDGTYWWLITVSSPYKPTGNLPVASPVKEVEGPNGQPLYIPIGPNPSGQNPNGQNPNDQSPVPIGTKPEVQPVIKPDGTIMYFMTNIAQPGQPGAKQVRKPDGTYWWLITVSSPYKPTGNLPVADPVKEVEGPNGQPLYIPNGPNPSGQNPNGQNPNDQSPVPIGTKPEVQPVIKPDGTIMYFMTNIAQPGQPGAKQVRKPDGTYWWLITVSSPYKPTGNLPVADPVKEVEGPNGQPLYIPIGPNPSGQNPNDQSPVPIGTKPEVQPVIKPDGTIMYFMTNIAQPGQPGANQVRKPDGTYWWLITVSSPYKPTGNLPVADPVKEVEGPNGQPLYIPIGPNPSGQNPNGQNPNDQSPVPIGTKPEVQPVIKPDGTIMYFMTNIAQPGQPGAKPERKPDGTYWWLITVSSPYKPTGTLPVADPVREVEGPDGQPQYIPVGQNPSGQPGQQPNGQTSSGQQQPSGQPGQTPSGQPGQPGQQQPGQQPNVQYPYGQQPSGQPGQPGQQQPGQQPNVQYPYGQQPSGQPGQTPSGQPGQPGQQQPGQQPNVQYPYGQQPNGQPGQQPNGQTSSGQQQPSGQPGQTPSGQPGQPGQQQPGQQPNVQYPYGQQPSGQPGQQQPGQQPNVQYPYGQQPSGQPGQTPSGQPGQQQPGQQPNVQYPYGQQPNGQPGQPGQQPNGETPNGQPGQQQPGQQPNVQYPYGQQPNGQQTKPIGNKPGVQPVIKPDGSIEYMITTPASPNQPDAKPVQQPDGSVLYYITIISQQKPQGNLPVEKPVKEVMGPNGEPQYIPSGQVPTKPQPTGQQTKPIGNKPGVQPVIKPDGSIEYMITTPASPNQPDAKPVQQPDGSVLYYITIISQQKPQGNLPVEKPVKEVMGPNGEPQYIPSGQVPTKPQPTGQQTKPIGNKPGVQPVIKPDGSIEYMITTPASPNQPDAKPVQQPDGSVLYFITIISQQKPQGNLPVEEPVKEVMGPNGEPQYIPSGQVPTKPQPGGQQPKPIGNKPGVQPVIKPDGSIEYMITTPASPNQPDAKPVQQPDGSVLYYITIISQQKPQGNLPVEKPVKEVMGPNGKPQYIPSGQVPTKPQPTGQQTKPIGNKPGVQPVIKPDGSIEYMITTPASPNQPDAKPVQQPDGSVLYFITIISQQKPQGNLPVEEPVKEVMGPNGEPQYIPSGQVPTKPQPGGQQPKPIGNKPGVQPVIKPDGSIEYMITTPASPNQPDAKPVQQPDGSVLYYITIISQQKPQGNLPVEKPVKEVMGPNGEPQYIPSGQVPTKPQPTGQQTKPIGNKPGVQPVIKPDGSIEYMITTPASPNQPDAKPVQQPDGSVLYYITIISQQKPQGNLPVEEPVKEVMGPNGEPQYIPSGQVPTKPQPGGQQPKPIGNKPGVQPVIKPDGSIEYMITTPASPNQPDAKPVQQPDGSVLYYITIISQQKPQGNLPVEKPVKEVMGPNGEPQYIPSGQVPTKPQPTGQQTKPIGNKPGVQPVIKPDGSIEYMITTPASPNQPDAKPVQQPDGSVLYFITIISQQKPQGNLPVEEPVKEVMGPNGEPQYIPSGQVPTKPQPTGQQTKPIGNKPGVQPVIKPDGSIEYMITTPASPNQPDAKPVQQPDGSVLYYITIISQQKPQGNLPVEKPVKEVMGPNGEPQYIPSGQVPTKPQPTGQQTKPIGNKPGVQPVIKPDGSIEYMITTPASPNQPDAKPVQQPDGSVLYYITIISQQKPQGNLPVEEPVKEVMGPNGEPQYIPSGQVPTKPQPTGQQTKPIGNKPGVQPVIKPDGSIEYMITTPASPNQPDAKPVQQPDGSVLYFITIISQQKPQGNLPVEEPVKEVMGPNGEPQYIPSGQVPTKPQPGGQQPKPIGNKPGVQPVIKPDGSIEYMITTPASPNQPDAKPVQQPDGSVLYYITIISQQKPLGNLPVEEPVKEVIGPNGEPQYIPSGQVPTKPQPTGQQTKPIGNKPGVQPVIKPDGSIVYMITTPASPNQPDAKPVQQPDGSVLYYITIISQQKPQGNLPVEKPVKEVMGPNGEPQYIPSGQVPTKPQPTGQQTKPIGNKPGVQPVIKPDGSIEYMITTPASPNQPDAKPVQQPDGSVLYFITIISQQKPQGNLPVEEPVKEVMGPNGEPQYIPSGQVPTKPQPGGQQPKPIGNKPGVQPVIKPDGSIEYMITTPASPNQPDAKPVQQPDGSVLYFITIISQQKPLGNLPVEEPVKEVMDANGKPQYIPIGQPQGQQPNGQLPQPINTPGVQKVVKPDGSILYVITRECSENTPGARPVQTEDGHTIYIITITSDEEPEDYEPPSVGGSIEYTITTTGGQGSLNGNTLGSIPAGAQQIVGPDGKITYVFSGNMPMNGNPSSMEALQSLIGSLPQDISKLITQGDFAGALSKLHRMGMDTSTEIAPGLTIESVLKNLNGSGNNVTIQGGVHVIGGSSESNQIGDNGLSSGSLSPNGNLVYSFGGSNGGQSNSFSLPNYTVQSNSMNYQR